MKFGNPQTAIVEVITCTNTGRDILFFEMPQQYIGKGIICFMRNVHAENLVDNFSLG